MKDLLTGSPCFFRRTFTKDSHLKNDQPGVAKAVKKGVHQELVMIGNPVVCQIFSLAGQGLRWLILVMMKITDAFSV